jgi:alpha-L-glutamate ligase-like protein
MNLIQGLRRLRAEVLGMNRRNIDLLQRYNRGPLYAVVDHKQETKVALAARGLPVPETYAVCSSPSRLSLLAEEMMRRSEFVLKPARGAGGEGVVVIAGRQQDRLVKASGTMMKMRDLVAHGADSIAGAFSLSQARDEAVLERRLTPEPVLAAYSPGGIPDVRVLVFRGVPIMAMLRLPTRASDGRANLHVGGVGVGLELATGRAVHAIHHDRPIAVHPDTQQPLAQLRVPEWDAILLFAARSYEAIPLGYFGIDVVVDVQLGPAILELNARPGLSIQLANHRGLRRTLEALRQRPAEKMSPRDRVALGVETANRTRPPAS